MMDYYPGINFESCNKRDNVVKLIQELQNRRSVLERALSTWHERYSDIINFEEELDVATLFAPLVRKAKVDEESKSSSSIDKCSADINFLKQIPAQASKMLDNEGEHDDGFSFFDQYLSTQNDEEDLVVGNENYFEVASVTNEETGSYDDDCISVQTILDNIQETRDKVSAKCDELEKVIADIGREASESSSLRERVGMTHRSLTLIEMRQEKVMREALYENVTSNNDIRRLHDEVIQLRIREAQHQSDIQRLMAENNRLKMKLMEARFHGSTAKKKKYAKAGPATAATEMKKSKEESFASTSSSGLHEIDDLNKPVCVGAIQRGSLRFFKTTDNRGTICVSDKPPSESQSRLSTRKGPCPLCNNLQDNDDYEIDDEGRTRSIGTSTADIENIVSVRTSIVVMGMVLPIPLFLSCLLRTIEESMLVLGRVCFSELPPYDPTFPGLQEEIMEGLNELYVKLKGTIS